MTYKQKISQHIKKEYGYDHEFGMHDKVRKDNNYLIWEYPASAGMMHKVIYSLDKNNQITSEEAVFEKNICIPKSKWEPFQG